MKRHARILGVAVALTALTATGAPLASAEPVADTLTISPSTAAVGHAILFEGGTCAPGEDVRVTLSYVPDGVSVGATNVTADEAGQFAGSIPMVNPTTPVPIGVSFELRADCGGSLQTDPDRFVIETGVVGDPADPTMAVRMQPNPINAGGTLTIEGVGCSADETVTFATDDPTIPVVTRTANGYGGFWGSVTTNPAAAAGSTLAVTVTCGPVGTPPDRDREWTGTVTYSGTTADPPVAAFDRVTTVEGVAVTIHPLSNDSGRDLRIVHVDQPSNGSAAISADQTTIDYAPDPGFFGVDTIDYAIENADGVSGSRIRVTVEPAPADPPETGDEDVETGDEGDDPDSHGGSVTGAEGDDPDGHGGSATGAEGDEDGGGDPSPESLPVTGSPSTLVGTAVLGVMAVIAGALALTFRRAMRR